MFGVGHTELFIVLAVAFLFFGNRLPKTMRSLGQGVTEFKPITITFTIQSQTELADLYLRLGLPEGQLLEAADEWVLDPNDGSEEAEGIFNRWMKQRAECGDDFPYPCRDLFSFALPGCGTFRSVLRVNCSEDITTRSSAEPPLLPEDFTCLMRSSELSLVFTGEPRALLFEDRFCVDVEVAKWLYR